MKSLEIVPDQQRVMTVIREAGQNGSFGAHIAFAAKRASRSVLMVDLTRDGLLTKTVLPMGTAPGALSASHLFAASMGGFAVEMLCPGFSLVRADARLIDSSLTVIGAATRLRKALTTLSRGFELCIIEADDEVSVESLAAMQISTNVMTTTCPALAKTRDKHAHAEHTKELACAAAVEQAQKPQMLTLPMPAPIPRDLDNRVMTRIADKTLRVACRHGNTAAAKAAVG